MKTPRYRLLGILGLIVMICSLFVYFQLRDLPFFRKKLILTAQFDQISSLTEGADVRFAGMQVGKVQSISFDKKTKKILVDFDVRPGIYLPKSTRALAYIPSILYAAKLDLVFEEGKHDAFLKTGDTIIGSTGSYAHDFSKSGLPLLEKFDQFWKSTYPNKEQFYQKNKSIMTGIHTLHQSTLQATQMIQKTDWYGLIGNTKKITGEISAQPMDSSLALVQQKTQALKEIRIDSQLSKIPFDQLKSISLGNTRTNLSSIQSKISAQLSNEKTELHQLLFKKAKKDSIQNQLNQISLKLENIRIHPEKTITLQKK